MTFSLEGVHLRLARGTILGLLAMVGVSACQAGSAVPLGNRTSQPAPVPAQSARQVATRLSASSVAPPAAGFPEAAVSANAAVVDPTPSPAPAPREPGKIQCGSIQCETGKEVCCQGKDVCLKVKPHQLTDFSELDAQCDAMGSLLVACNDSPACGANQVCCEIIWGSGENEPVVCSDPRPGERLPCDFREACVPQEPCRTRGAQCVNGWCTVPRPKHSLRCGGTNCSLPGDICCALPTHKEVCTSEEKCRQAPDAVAMSCTAPADCAEGEFCSLAVPGSACSHSWDGMTEALCETPADCPLSIRNWCKQRGEFLVCARPAAPVTGAQTPYKQCSCRP